MEPSSPGYSMLAPGAAGPVMLRCPSPSSRTPTGPVQRFPGVDDHLVVPETSGEEVVNGRRMLAMPALEAHADPQASLAYLVRAHIREGYVAATELLTRCAQDSDFATDVCVRRRGVDPQSGQRYLEELAFEVATSQSLTELSTRAPILIRRGVRRVFALMLHDRDNPRVLEWHGGTWISLPGEGVIVDEACLHRPLPVMAVLDAAVADNAVAQVLLAKKNPVLVQAQQQSEAKGLKEGEAKGLKEGEAKGLKEGVAKGLKEGEAKGLKEGVAKGVIEGKASALIMILVARGLSVSDAQRAHIYSCGNSADLDLWMVQALTANSVAELLSV